MNKAAHHAKALKSLALAVVLGLGLAVAPLAPIDLAGSGVAYAQAAKTTKQARRSKTQDPLKWLAKAMFDPRPTKKTRSARSSKPKESVALASATANSAPNIAASEDETASLGYTPSPADTALGRISTYEAAKKAALASGSEEDIAAANALINRIFRKKLDDETIASLDRMLGIVPTEAERTAALYEQQYSGL